MYALDSDWVEDRTLRDGTTAQLRFVCPSDRDTFLGGFEHLSSESRYKRFFTAKPTLNESEIRYLTEVDGVDHVAIGAVRVVGDSEEGLGVARFVRLAARPDTADAAVAVVDDAQGLGLGKALLTRLADAAVERGIVRFQCDVLLENRERLASRSIWCPAWRPQNRRTRRRCRLSGF